MATAEPDVDGRLPKLDDLSMSQLRALDATSLSNVIRSLVGSLSEDRQGDIAAFSSNI